MPKQVNSHFPKSCSIGFKRGVEVVKKFPSIGCRELTNINQYKTNKECLIIRRLSVDGINGGASASWGALWRSHQNWSKDWPFQAQATPLLLCFYAFLFVFLENSGKKKNRRGNVWILCGLFSYALGLPPMKELTQFC